MGISGISGSLSDDFLGLGHLFDQIGGTGAGGTNVCGSRPTCIGNGRSCKQKQATYEICLLANIEANKQIGMAGTGSVSRDVQAPGQTNGGNKAIYVISAVVVVVLLIALLRR